MDTARLRLVTGVTRSGQIEHFASLSTCCRTHVIYTGRMAAGPAPKTEGRTEGIVEVVFEDIGKQTYRTSGSRGLVGRAFCVRWRVVYQDGDLRGNVHGRRWQLCRRQVHDCCRAAGGASGRTARCHFGRH